MSNFWDIYQLYEDERIRTEANQRHYRKVLSELENWLHTDFLSITPSQANDFYNYIKASKLAITTKNERLRIVKSIGGYMEEKISDYRSPFTHLRPYSRQSFLKKEEMLTMEELSLAMAIAENSNNWRAFLAMVLAFRLCLTTSEIVSLRSIHFKKGNDEQMYLTVPAKEFRERTIVVPEDVYTIMHKINPSFFAGEISTLIYNDKTRMPIKEVTITKQIAIISKKAGIPMTLQSIRNLGILLYYKTNPDKNLLAEYLGSKGNWLFRFDRLAKEPINNIKSQNVTIHLNGEVS